MKKLLLFVFAVFAFAACTQNDVEELSANRADVPEILTVGFEGGDDTRIQLNEAQKTVWTKDDIVSVFYRSNANQKWQFQGETGERVGNLRRVSDATATETMHRTVVVYPYNENYYINPETYNIDAMLPAMQHYAEDSYGVGENLMVSQSEFTQFSLKNVFGWLKIQLTGNGEKVTSLTLRGNKEEQLAGLIYVDTATAESTLASEMGSSDDNNAGGNLIFDDTIVTELTLDCGEGVVLGAEATAFYIAVPPQTFEQGVAVEILCDGYKPMTLATTSEVVIERNHIKPMASIAFEDEEVIPYNEIRYTATAKVEEDSYYPWTFDTFGANVVSNEWDSESGKGVITFDADVTTIGDCAFIQCSSLTSVTIPDSVTTIGGYAFDSCSSLTSITTPDSVTTIGYMAFYNCNSLTSITIGDSVTTIEYGAFAYCDSLTSITIPDSVTTIGGAAFHYCTNLVEFNGKFASEDSRCLIVDGTLNSFALGCGATEYTIPDSVTTIGEWAFSFCYSLTSVTIPDSVTTIGESAFCECNSLTSVTIGDSVTTIGQEAFAYCFSLTNITIPDSVTTIGGGAFIYCSNLTSVYCKATTPPSLDGNVFYANALGRTIYVPAASVEAYKAAAGWSEYADYIVGNDFSITSIINYTTSDDQIINASLPIISNTYSNGIGTIELLGSIIPERAFCSCDSLTSVTIGDSVTTIGEWAFAYCSNLTSVYCEAITPPVLGNDYVFDDNGSGRKIYVPAESVDAYKSAEYWSEYADAIVGYDFENGVVVEPEGNEANRKIHYTATAKVEAHSDYPWTFDTFGANILSHDYNAETGEGVITFDTDVTTIGKRAFPSCHSLTSVTIPDSVTTIGMSAFENCDSLTSVTIPDSVTTIGMAAFENCDSLTEFNSKFASEDGRCLIVDGTLNSFAPAGLTAYTIPDSVTTIGYSAFEDCDSLTSITIPDSVTTIGETAFHHCSNLTSITIPDSVTTIEEWAFSNCDSLTSITIPDSVTTIGNYAFGACDSLTEFKGKFASEDSRCLIVDGTLNSFAPAGLTSYTIPDSVTTIGKNAFDWCDSLTSVTIPDSVTTIGGAAFYYCDSLTSVTIPDSVTTIGARAFFDCKSLTSVYCEATTPPSLGGSYVFDYNASDRKIYVPAESVEAYKSAENWSEYADAIVGYDFENGVVVE